MFACSTLGDPTEDGTLVYLWLRPVRRVVIVAAAVFAAFTVTWPVVVAPLAVSGLLTVATANTAAARLAVRSYSRSILSDTTGVDLGLADFTMLSAWSVPLLVGLAGAAYATRRLSRMDVA